jgi:hypothetical protein
VAVAFITWLWGDKYNESHVAKLAAGVWRNYKKPHRFVVFSDRALRLPTSIDVKPIRDLDLIGRGCFCRLRMFDPQWQAAHGFDDRIVNLDLDLVLVAPMDDLFEHKNSFLILKGVNATNPNPFNCSVMMLRAGCHADVWSDFSVEKAGQVAFHEFPDDQGWLWHKLPDAAGWKGGKPSGIYGFQKPGWPKWAGITLPPNARIVAFIGWRKPDSFIHFAWVRAHWRVG